MDQIEVQKQVAGVAERFAADRRARQLRRHLEIEDFEALAKAGFTLTGVPASLGGLWTDLQGSIRPLSEILRTLARGDASVALVSSMHIAVLSLWLIDDTVPEPYTGAWKEQRERIFGTALDGAFWGTVTSEPGSAGDVTRTRAKAVRLEDGAYGLHGQKHFGSGSGMASYMITTAIPEGEDGYDFFFMDTRDAKWDGSTGMRLVAEWDGHGMAATQSHGFELTGYRSERIAYPSTARGPAPPPAFAVVGATIFTAVLTGVLESAVAAARAQLLRRKDDLRPFEAVEWTRVENEMWLVEQAYEGMLRAVESRGAAAGLDALHAKTAVAELAESATGRICRVIGGGSYNRSSPFGAAFEDVRALGFLRPPWTLAYDTLLARTWDRADQGQAAAKD